MTKIDKGAYRASRPRGFVQFVRLAARMLVCPVCGECEFADGEGARYSNALENLRLSQKEVKSIKND